MPIYALLYNLHSEEKASFAFPTSAKKSNAVVQGSPTKFFFFLVKLTLTVGNSVHKDNCIKNRAYVKFSDASKMAT